MLNRKILQEDRSYTFRSYFELPYETDEILAEFSYTLLKTELTLPQSDREIEPLQPLKQKLKTFLSFVNLSNETARRETLVAPILLEIVCYCSCQLRIEYALNVNNWLKGNLDYLLLSKSKLLVIEAQNDDLTRGFTQLAVELIALSQVEESATLYGIITMGDVWRFAKLDRQQQQILQDITLFKIPDDLGILGKILVGILQT
ncbi:MAG: hypothetical protein J7647_31380 [Cyanobacteria bacterium SBLK]|nr:hypothetical protein [Cyanobacteria bacterium SBLK]